MAPNDAQRITTAIRYLEQHYQQQPSLANVADAVGLSPHHFQRLFRRWAGVSPKRFMQYLTLEHTRQALREGRSLLATSLDAGLSGPGRLHDLFVTFEAMTPGEFKAGGRGLDVTYGIAPSPFGDALIAETSRGICGLAFTDADAHTQTLDALLGQWPLATVRMNQLRASATANRVFHPTRAPERLLLDLRGSNFQIKVWEALLRIPMGTLVSYGDVAAAIGKPTAHRSVATAVAHNPVSFLIPCHRVIRHSGVVGDYRWGAERKRAMVAWEAAQRSRVA
jgi:AraC family transcriptional regulator of adaptative response/methylated-DNA-[protein]-cysteine methyltransferase